MAQTTFDADPATNAALELLKKKFGVKTNAQVIRKALALARVAAERADDNNTVTIVDKDKKETSVLLSA